MTQPNRPKYRAELPYWPGRPTIAKIEATYVNGEGWCITLTPNKTVLEDPEFRKEWDDLMPLVEKRFRYFQAQEYPPRSPVCKEIEAYYQTVTSLVSETPPKHTDGSYVIRAYDSGTDCKLELKALLTACASLSFKERTDEDGDPAKHKLLNTLDAILATHQMGIFDYIKQRAEAAAAR